VPKLKKEKNAEDITNSLANLSLIAQMVLHADHPVDLEFQVLETCASMHRKTKIVKALMKILVMPSQTVMQDLNAEKLTE